jgi:hypothetical protein
LGYAIYLEGYSGLSQFGNLNSHSQIADRQSQFSILNSQIGNRNSLPEIPAGEAEGHQGLTAVEYVDAAELPARITFIGLPLLCSSSISI